jgi:DNA-binding LacI/PurR family transcriptional regulator
MMPKVTTVAAEKKDVLGAPPRPAAYNPRWSKLQTVAAQLEEMAFSLGPGAQLPRVADLCRQLGSSITTVNAALGDLEGRGILQRRPGVGNFVASNLHRANILLLCNAGLLSRPELSPFWAMLIQNARARAGTNALGFDLQFAEPTFGKQPEDAPVLSESVTRLIEQGRVSGAVAIGLEAGTMSLLQRHGFPVVSFAGPADYAVMQDMEDQIRLGVQTLAKAGAERIALWSPHQTFAPPDAVRHFQDAFVRTFQEAVTAAGLPFEKDLVRQNRERAPLPDSFTDTSYQRQGYETALSVFASESGRQPGITPPDAILSTDDMLTVGALSAFRRCGVEVSRTKSARGSGDKRSVLMATHANVGSPVLIGYEEDLFLLENDPADVVAALFSVLEALMAGDDSVSHRVLVRGRLRLPDKSPVSL